MAVSKWYVIFLALPVLCSCEQNNASLVRTGQGLISIPPGSEYVASLTLSDNNLQSLHNESFATFINLKDLNLERNKIATIECGTFSALKSLETIDLSWNYLRDIHPDVFINNNQLKTVVLRGNSLDKVHFSVPFLNAPSLVNLDLSFCTIRYLTNRTFALLTALESLDLGSNHIRRLSVETLNYLPKLRVINLRNNRWTCGSDLCTLLDWVDNLRPKKHPPVYCYEDKGNRLVVTPGEQRCVDVLRTSLPSTISVRPIGESFTMQNSSHQTAEVRYEEEISMVPNTRTHIASLEQESLLNSNTSHSTGRDRLVGESLSLPNISHSTGRDTLVGESLSLPNISHSSVQLKLTEEALETSVSPRRAQISFVEETFTDPESRGLVEEYFTLPNIVTGSLVVAMVIMTIFAALIVIKCLNPLLQQQQVDRDEKQELI